MTDRSAGAVGALTAAERYVLSAMQVFAESGQWRVDWTKDSPQRQEAARLLIERGLLSGRVDGASLTLAGRDRNPNR